ncbi:MAG: hypothetical protein HYS17_06810 [Micavibrio aeruginosavorus]|uniref:Uncharacterized protein n=1 Tax=Micavibrio aeruginosavorus TaxID=349221 RepID=A0A7T5UFJ8_9BACT|nr:MAG: hypothetical protein HYS17_06810 [Micavibrio aeruginosavorus]
MVLVILSEGEESHLVVLKTGFLARATFATIPHKTQGVLGGGLDVKQKLLDIEKRDIPISILP